ncbi:MAG: tripartite tricarboxylate transporter permease [Firmicutes bacterium]|nr:tripartite tricarboxylate transporter permease [Bacillota bacterium]
MLGMTATTIILVFVGTTAGIIFGFLPGLSATMGVALLMPFTFGMDIINSMALLLGVYCGGIYGGSITAILIRTPGTPAAAATVLDGYPMTKAGRAREALSLATIGSFWGGIFSCIVLSFAAGALAKFALRFGAPEYFAVGIFGMSMVTSLAAKNPMKGIISAMLGFMLSTIGIDSITGTPRFTLGNVRMMAGIEIVTALVGLFAISEVLSDIGDSVKPKVRREVAHYEGKSENLFRFFVKYPVNFIRSAVIGTVVGIIPATGGGTASWMSYNEAKRASKEPDSFGEGNPNGVVASEVANNAVTGGALIPLLALGVPGDTVTAVLLGALMLQGITPGPMLFVNRPEVATGIYILMIFANIAMCFLGLVCVRAFLRILKVPESVLMSIVLSLCCIGAFAVRGYSFDIKCALIMGVFGYFFQKTGYPVPPILLGLILGKTVEANFRRAMQQAMGDWTVFFTHPICCVLLIISIAAFLFPIIRWVINWNKERKAAAAIPETAAEAAAEAGGDDE